MGVLNIKQMKKRRNINSPPLTFATGLSECTVVVLLPIVHCSHRSDTVMARVGSVAFLEDVTKP